MTRRDALKTISTWSLAAMTRSSSATPHDAARRGQAWPFDEAFSERFINREELAQEFITIKAVDWIDPGPGTTKVREWWYNSGDHSVPIQGHAYQWNVNVFPVELSALVQAAGTNKVILEMLDAAGAVLSTLELSSVFTALSPGYNRSTPVVTADGVIVTRFNGLRCRVDPALNFDAPVVDTLLIYLMPFFQELAGTP